MGVKTLGFMYIMCPPSVEKCINNLLVLSSDYSPITSHNDSQRPSSQGCYSEGTTPVSPPRKKEGSSWNEVASNSKYSRNSQKRSQHKKQVKFHDSRPPMNSSQLNRQQFSPGGNGNKVRQNGPQGRGGNYGDRPHPYEPVEAQDKWRKREPHSFQPRVPVAGAPRRPLLSTPFPPPGPRGFIRPPGNIHPPNPPNFQYYPSGRPFRGPPPWNPHYQGPPYGSTLQPIINNGPPGGGPMGPVAYSGMPMEPNGTLMGPPYNAMPMVDPQITSVVDQTPMDSQLWTHLTPPPLSVYTHELMAGGLVDPLLSDSYTPVPPDHQIPIENDQDKGRWPLVTEPGTEHVNLTQSSSTHESCTDTNVDCDTEPSSGVNLAEVGQEWLKWDGGHGTLTTNKRLVILRGLPGSGKSTLAR